MEFSKRDSYLLHGCTGALSVPQINSSRQIQLKFMNECPEFCHIAGSWKRGTNPAREQEQKPRPDLGRNMANINPSTGCLVSFTPFSVLCIPRSCAFFWLLLLFPNTNSIRSAFLQHKLRSSI